MKKTYFGTWVLILQYEIIEGLNLKTIFGADLSRYQTYEYHANINRLQIGQQRSTQTELDNTHIKNYCFKYDYFKLMQSFADKHDISAVADGICKLHITTRNL